MPKKTTDWNKTKYSYINTFAYTNPLYPKVAIVETIMKNKTNYTTFSADFLRILSFSPTLKGAKKWVRDNYLFDDQKCDEIKLKGPWNEKRSND